MCILYTSHPYIPILTEDVSLKPMMPNVRLSACLMPGCFQDNLARYVLFLHGV